MALGTFAVGTESFMIAPLLPQLASDLSQSLGKLHQSRIRDLAA
jgi:predicted MFS family arabinose efflux permease